MLIHRLLIRDVKNNTGRCRVNISTLAIRLQHNGILAIMCSYTKLNLRIVAAHNQMPLRRLDKITHPYGIIGFSRHILTIRLRTIKPSCVCRQSKKVRMQLSCRLISKLKIAVNISRFNLAPLAILLHQGKKLRQLRLMNITPFLQHNHGGVICCLTIRLCHLEHRQSQVLIQILLEGIGTTVTADIHISNHKGNLLTDSLHLSFSLRLTLQHQLQIHRNPIAFHNAKVHCCRRFNILYKPPMLWKELVKPVIKNVHQPQCKIRICTAIANRLRIRRIKFIKMLPVRH